MISELWIEASYQNESATIGDELIVRSGEDITLTIRFLDPRSDNAHGENPEVRRVDVITGKIHGVQDNLGLDINPSTKVVARFGPRDWKRDGAYRVIETTIPAVDHDMYIRVRGTNSDELEPELDPKGEDPWSDLWFYANPVFVAVQ